MKNYLIAIVAAFAFITSAYAQKTASADVTAATPALLLSGGKYVVQDILFASTSTNVGTFWFYDSPTNTVTNLVTAATVSISTVATNWTQVFTNATGIVVTNTFTGISHLSTAVGTNLVERTRLRQSIVVAGGIVVIPSIALQPTSGLVVYSTVPGIVQLTYKQFEP
jgi:hypothetical protein